MIPFQKAISSVVNILFGLIFKIMNESGLVGGTPCGLRENTPLESFHNLRTEILVNDELSSYVQFTPLLKSSLPLGPGHNPVGLPVIRNSELSMKTDFSFIFARTGNFKATPSQSAKSFSVVGAGVLDIEVFV